MPVTGRWRQRFVRGDELTALTRHGTSVYQQPEWARAIEEGVGYRAVGVLSEAERPVVLSVWFEAQRGPLRLIGSPLPGCFTAYQRPLWLDGTDACAGHEALQQHVAFVRRTGYASVECIVSDSGAEFAAVARRTGATISEVPTIILDVASSADAMWHGMESRGRNMVRKAERSGVCVRQCRGTTEEITTYYGMLRGTFAKSGVRPPHPEELYRALVRHLIPADRLLFLAAELGGRTLAMALFVHDDREMFFTSGTSLPGVGAYAPNNLIQWHAIQFAVARGLRLYDLGGTGRVLIDRFKTSFGGRRHAYVKASWRSPLMRAASSVYLRTRPSLERVWFLLSRLRGAGPAGDGATEDP